MGEVRLRESLKLIILICGKLGKLSVRCWGLGGWGGRESREKKLVK
jgi:hypothetical protein